MEVRLGLETASDGCVRCCGIGGALDAGPVVTSRGLKLALEVVFCGAVSCCMVAGALEVGTVGPKLETMDKRFDFGFSFWSSVRPMS
jgi:hypothetical protein